MDDAAHGGTDALGEALAVATAMFRVGDRADDQPRAVARQPGGDDREQGTSERSVEDAHRVVRIRHGAPPGADRGPRREHTDGQIQHALRREPDTREALDPGRSLGCSGLREWMRGHT
jgi:hypothetical protein